MVGLRRFLLGPGKSTGHVSETQKRNTGGNKGSCLAMSGNKYILDEHGNPKVEPDLINGRNGLGKLIAMLTQLSGDPEISTGFLGMPLFQPEWTTRSMGDHGVWWAARSEAGALLWQQGTGRSHAL